MLDDFPNLPCPTCENGNLIIMQETKINKYPSFIQTLPDHPSEAKSWLSEDGREHRGATLWDIEGTSHEITITSFFLRCNRDNCQEVVSTCGESKTDGYWIDDPEEPYFRESLYYFPKLFYPTIKLFKIPDQTPDSIKNELSKSFALFWSQPSACANSLRKTVERIVDDLIGKPLSLRESLNNRIEKLSEEYKDLKLFLMATKWIGNDGSHEESELSHYDVIMGFRFIEKSLIELYESKKIDLNLIAQKINKEKRSPSRQRRKLVKQNKIDKHEI